MHVDAAYLRLSTLSVADASAAAAAAVFVVIVIYPITTRRTHARTHATGLS